MRKPYAPEPDSFADKTIKLLLSHSDGTKVTSNYLSRAFGVPSKQVASLLAIPVKHELLAVERDDEDVTMYSLGVNGLALRPNQPAQAADGGNPNEGQFQHSIVSAKDLPPPATTAAKSVFHLANALPSAEPLSAEPAEKGPLEQAMHEVTAVLRDPAAQVLKIEPQATAIKTKAPFLCALYNSGEFLLVGKAGELMLEPDELREMVAYLDKVCGAAREAA